MTFSFHISLEILSRKKSTLLHIFSKLILNQCFQQTQYLEKNYVGSLSPTGTVKEDRDLRRGKNLHRGKGFQIRGPLLLTRDTNVDEHTPHTVQFVDIRSVRSSLHHDVLFRVRLTFKSFAGSTASATVTQQLSTIAIT